MASATLSIWDALATALAGFRSFFWESLAWAGGGTGNREATRTVSMAYKDAPSPIVAINSQRTHDESTMTSGKLTYLPV
jgi:hypothetical protein